MKFGFALNIVIIIGIFLSCNNSKKAMEEETDIAKLNKLFEMKKNPCFGKCPAYKLVIYENGLVSFDGKRFVTKMGMYTKKLTKREFEGIQRAFNASDFF